MPLGGESLRSALRALATRFDRDAVPTSGRYVGHPAVFGPQGVISVPPDVPHPLLRGVVAAGIGFAAGMAFQAARPRRVTDPRR